MARMNTGIPMMGDRFDLVGSLDQGAAAAARANEIGQINALRAYQQQFGGDMFAGDENALRGFAQFDPVAAFNMQSGFDDRAWQAEAREMDRQRFGMEQQRFNADMAGPADDPNAFMQQVLTGALLEYQRGDKKSVAAWFERNGVDPNAIPYEMVPTVAAQAGIIGPDDFNMFEPQEPDVPAGFVTLQMRAAEAGLQPGTPEYQAFMANNGDVPRGTQLSVAPDGTVIFAEGAGVGTGGNLTEGQSKDLVYAIRARDALTELEQGNPDALTSYGQTILGAVPLNIGRAFQSEEFQTAENAGTRFLQAILRKDTGAAITADEQRQYGGVFLPQPGDTPAMSEVRRGAREAAITALENGLTPQAILSQARALEGLSDARDDNPPPAGAPTAQVDFSGIPFDQLVNMDVLKMSAAELAAWNAALDALEGR
jgi:hypothetical protein